MNTQVSERENENGWIQSPGFDLAAFILVPLSSLVVLGAVLGASWGMPLVVAATYLVAIPHYMSSLTFFLGDDNLEYYRSRRVAFFVGPVVIFAAVLVLRVLGFHNIVVNTMYTWNIWHVSLQSAGILAIYRGLNGGPSTEKGPARTAIFLWNSTMAFWFIERFPPLYGWLSVVHPGFPNVLRWTLLGAAAWAVVRFARLIFQRERPIAAPEAAFLVSSFLLFLPYLWVEDSNLATFGMLMGHFIQYLSIVWLLQYRKYHGAGGTTRQRWLGTVSGRPVFLAATIIGTGLVFYLAESLAGRWGIPMAYIILWNSLSLIHFYLDGLIWAFRQPFIRKSIGTYLMQSASR